MLHAPLFPPVAGQLLLGALALLLGVLLIVTLRWHIQRAVDAPKVNPGDSMQDGLIAFWLLPWVFWLLGGFGSFAYGLWTLASIVLR